MWAAYALCQLPSGVLGDRFGERRIVLLSMSVMGIGSLLLALSPSFFLFGVFAIILGAGTGLYYSVAASLLTKLFDETGQALGIHSGAGAAAGLFVPGVAAYLGVRFGWEVTMLLGLAMAISTVMLFFWYVRPTPTMSGSERTGKNSPLELSVLARILLQPRIAYTAFLAATGVFSWQAMQSFYPMFLVEYHDFSTQLAGGVFGLIFLLSTVGQPVAGKLSDSVGRDTVIAINFSVTAIAFAGVLVLSGFIQILVLTGLIGMGMSWFPVIQARIMDGFSDSARSSQFGLVRTVYMFVGALGSVATGTLVDVAGWTAAYGLLIGILAFGSLSLILNKLLQINSTDSSHGF